MRVYDQNLNNAAAAQSGAAREVAGTDRAGTTRTHGNRAEGDHVELSHTLSALSHALGVHETGREARVQELAAQYGRGEYRPNAAATSRAIVSDALAAG